MFWGLFEQPCSFFFNRFGPWSWAHCCEDHDQGYHEYELAYDRAGARLMLDEALRECVNKVLPPLGWLMFYAVRLFGRFSYGRK